MAERDALAAAKSSDNSTAEGLADEDFFFEGEDGQLVGQGDDETPLNADDVADGTETPEELGEEQQLDAEDGEETAVVQPGQAPVAPAAVVPPVAPVVAPPPQAPVSEEAPQRVPTFHEAVSANFPAAVDRIVAGGAFRLSPEDAEILDPAAIPVIERMSAKVYLHAITTVSKMLHEALPAAVNGIVGVRSQAEQAETGFFKDYGFDAATHKGELTRVAQFVKLQNPNLQGKAYADEVARMGYAMLGVTPPARKPVGNGQAKPGVPAKPGARVVTKKSFTPAARAGGGQPQNRRAPGQPPAKIDPMADLSAMLSSSVEMDD